MSTHQIREAMELATDVAMLERGRIIFSGPRSNEMLLDPGWKVANQFHLDGGIPKSFLFDRDGKLVAMAIDMRTQRQFLNMLAVAGVHP